MTYAVRHRTASLGKNDELTIPCRRVSPWAYLPSLSDWDDAKDRMEILVQRTLVQHVPALQHIKNRVQQHIPHEYSDEMEEKSYIVNLGAVDANPSTTIGVIEVLQMLHQYVPTNDQKLHRIICNGDQLSMERRTHAKHSRIRGESMEDRLEGVIETPQEFHKEGLMAQVSIMFTS